MKRRQEDWGGDACRGRGGPVPPRSDRLLELLHVSRDSWCPFLGWASMNEIEASGKNIALVFQCCQGCWPGSLGEGVERLGEGFRRGLWR